MTTERRGLTGAEWKLLLVAALGIVYTASWLALAAPAPAASIAKRPRRPTAAVARAAPPERATRVRTRSS
jgi:hypothetical protein